MTVNERIKLLFKSTGKSYTDLAKEMNVTNQYISGLVKDKGVGAKPIKRLKEHFPLLNLEWLILGKGDMFLNESENNVLYEPSSHYGTEHKAFDTLKEQLEIKDKQIEKLLDILAKK